MQSKQPVSNKASGNTPHFGKGSQFFFGDKQTSFFKQHAIQPKLNVSAPDDACEQEAERVADTIVYSETSPGKIVQNTSTLVNRKCKECEDEALTVQQKAEGAAPATPSVAAKLSQSSGRGSALPSRTLSEMNASFGQDFSNVKIHTDQEAVAMNAELHAQAFTHGNDVYFNAGKFNPESPSGKHLVAHELTHVIQQRGNRDSIARKIEVPFANAKPFHSKNPKADTQGNVVAKLLNKLCVEGGITLVGNSVRMPVDLCDLPGPLDGNMALSKAEQSKTKVGCTCLCEIDKSTHIVRIVIDDDVAGTTLADSQGSEIVGVGSGSTVTVPSPDAPQTSLPTASGTMKPVDQVINLGHELCGHAFLNIRGEAKKDHNAQRGRGGHQATIERENLIRDEQGVERRGTFRDPFCGEVTDGSFIEECKKWREEYNLLNGTNFDIADTIPEDPLEEKPADFRIEVSFNTDMPLAGQLGENSFNVSVTSQGKEMFGFALAVFQDHPDKNFQLEAHASSDKPAGNPDYNRQLSERRVRLVLAQLIRRGVDENRLDDKADSQCDSIDTGLKNCSDTEAGAPGTAADRKVVIRIF